MAPGSLCPADYERWIVDDGKKQFQLSYADADAATERADSAWQRRAQHAERVIHRLSERLKSRDKEIVRLRNALVDTASLFQEAKAKLEQDLESADTGRYTTTVVSLFDAKPSPGLAETVVRLPYITTTLIALFEMMSTFYADFDNQHPPKSIEVARAIDRKLNYRGQSGNEPSRTGQTYAAAIRPEWIRESDRRHHHDRNPDSGL